MVSVAQILMAERIVKPRFGHTVFQGIERFKETFRVLAPFLCRGRENSQRRVTTWSGNGALGIGGSRETPTEILRHGTLGATTR